MKKLLLIALALALAGCAGAGALQHGTITLPPGGDVLVACATCACPTATPAPTAEPTLGPAGRDHLVPDSVATVDGAGNYSQVEPGDRLLVASTRSAKLTVRRVRGTDSEPVMISNIGGPVVIDDGAWAGIEFVDCQHVRLSGTGSADEYGFVLRGATTGLQIHGGSEHIEIERVEVGPTKGIGIRAYSKLADVPSGWVQRDVAVHDCYVHDTGREAMYLGNYATVAARCDGFYVYDNLLENIGHEGLQFKNAANVDAHGNRLVHIGILESKTQPRAAIDLQRDHGSSGRVWDNHIEDARWGIELNGAGPTEIYGNIIVGCGFREDGGGGIRWYGGDGMHIHGNVIAGSNDYGIKVSSGRTGFIENNTICGTVSGIHIKSDTVKQRGNTLAEVCE